MGNTDLELLGRYVEARDAEAFAELVARHRDMVYAACYRVLGSRADAEDSAQECFLRLARSADSIRTSVAGWLHRVAVRCSLSMHRQNGSRRKMEQEVAGMLGDNAAEPSWDRIRADIDQAIDSLPEALRETLVLHFLEGKPQTAIAEELGLSQPAVSQRIKRALERLRRHLKGAGLAVSAGSLAALLTTHGSEAAPATLVAELGRIALSGIGSSPAATGAGVAATVATKAKIACTLAATLVVGAAVHQALRGPARANQPDPTPPAAPMAAAPSPQLGAVAARLAALATRPEPIDDKRPARTTLAPSPPREPVKPPFPRPARAIVAAEPPGEPVDAQAQAAPAPDAPAATEIEVTRTQTLQRTLSITLGTPDATRLRTDVRALTEDDGAGAVDAPGVALRHHDDADPLLCTLITDVISIAKAALERALPQAETKDMRVYVVDQQGWYETTTTNRRDTIYIQPGAKGIGEYYRADAGPVGILCQAVAELYNPERIPGLERYLTHAHLVPAVTEALGPAPIPTTNATPLAADGAEMLDIITSDDYAPVHPDFAAVVALRAMEEELGLDGLRALLAEIPADAEDPFAALREAAVARDPALSDAFWARDEADALLLEPDGTCLITSFEDDMAFTTAPRHPLGILHAPLVLRPHPRLPLSQSPEWGADGMLSLKFTGDAVQAWMTMGLWDPDWKFKDWRRFSKFEMDFMIESPRPERFRIRLHDDVWHGHGQVYVFNGTVQPGEMVHIDYPLNRETLRGARTWESPYFDGRFRASEVTNIEFMFTDPAAPITLYIDNLRLTPRTGDEPEPAVTALPRATARRTRGPHGAPLPAGTDAGGRGGGMIGRRGTAGADGGVGFGGGGGASAAGGALGPLPGAGGGALPRPGVAVPRPGVAVPRPGVAVPRPGVAVPRPDVALKGDVVAGTVLGPDMQPVAGADVGVNGERGYAQSFDDLFTRTTDENGAFEFEVGVGPERLNFPWSIWARHRERGLVGCVAVQDLPPPERPVSILLTEGSGVTTRILDPEGNPLPGIETSVWLTPRGLGGFAGPRSDQDGNL
ncbi:MAG: sigma-70 family RNA polymerase sigma factor, partial [Armatimonadota bacterium]